MLTELSWVAGTIVIVSNYLKGCRDKKRVARGWVLAVVSNVIFFWLNYKAGLYGLMPLAAINLALSIRALREWSK